MRERKMVNLTGFVGKDNTVDAMVSRALGYQGCIENIISAITDERVGTAKEFAESKIEVIEQKSYDNIFDQMVYLYLIRIYNELDVHKISLAAGLANQAKEYITEIKNQMNDLDSNLDIAEASAWL